MAQMNGERYQSSRRLWIEWDSEMVLAKVALVKPRWKITGRYL